MQQEASVTGREREHNMSNSNRVALALLTSVSTLSIQVAKAQDETAASRSGIDEMIVSATKRDEGLQDVPVSVTAFSQDELDKRGYTNLQGVQEATPNLNFSVQSAGQNVARVTLRGIGTETLVGGGDPGVALHIDGVYVGRNSVAAGDIFDIERVEILRGPQGTLYGRNATGGSINLITKRPTDELEGNADVTYGNFNQFRARGVLNVPITDNLSSRIALYSDKHDGYIENLFDTGRDSFDRDNQGGRIQFLWSGDSGNEILVRGYYSSYGGVGPGSVFLGDDIGTANGYPTGGIVGVSGGPVPPAGAPVIADVYNNATTVTGASVLSRPDSLYQVRKDAPEFLDQTIKGVDLEGSFNLSESVLLRSVTSYQTNDNEILVDADGSELPIETRQRRNEANQFSQEFNVLSQNDSAFQWLLGAYFYHEELEETFRTTVPSGLLPDSVALPPGAVPNGGGVAQLRIAEHEVNSYALFAQLSYDLTDRLTATAGVRHTWDSKNQSRSIGGQVDLTNNFLFMGGGATGPLPPTTGNVDFSAFTYRFSLDYAVSDNSLLYASYARGYKSGGFDFNGGQLVGASLNEQVPYNPEFVNAYEVGSKNKFFDNRILLNLTGFYYDYTDLQVFRLTAFGPLTDNAAESTIWGVEAETEFLIADAFRIDGSVGYLDATYDEYTIDIPPTDFSGNTLNYAPKWTAHVGAEYTTPIGADKELIGRVDWSYRSDTFFDRANTAFDTQEAYNLVNLRLRLNAESWYFDVFANNVADKEYVTGQLINPPFNCGCRTVNIGAPRTYGATVGVRF